MGSTTLFTPVNINGEQVVDFPCVPLCFLLQIQKPSHFKDYLESRTLFFYIILYSICPKYKSITANYILEFNDTSLSNFMLSESVKFSLV